MNLKNLVYEGINKDTDSTTGFLWEDAVRGPIQFGNSHSLLRAAETGQRQMVQRYLSGLDSKLIPGSGMSIGENAHTAYIGTLDDILHDIIVVPTEQYQHGVLSPRLAIPAAAKAYNEAIDEVRVAQMDRDKQDWYWFRVTGDFRGASDAMEGMVEGKTPDPRLSLTVTPDTDFNARVDSYLWSLNFVPSGRKTKVIHPSEISTSECDRRIGYGLLGEEGKDRVESKLRRIFDVGHVFHDVIQRSLSWVAPGFRSEVRVRNRELLIEGSCDGVLPDGKTGLEIKSIGSAGFRKLTRAKPEHIQQATIYGALLDLETVSYLYVCKDDGELLSFDVPVDRGLWHQVATRAERILSYTKKGDLPAGIDKPSVCKSCKYAWTCKPEDQPLDKKRMFSR